MPYELPFLKRRRPCAGPPPLRGHPAPALSPPHRCIRSSNCAGKPERAVLPEGGPWNRLVELDAPHPIFTPADEGVVSFLALRKLQSFSCLCSRPSAVRCAKASRVDCALRQLAAPVTAAVPAAGSFSTSCGFIGWNSPLVPLRLGRQGPAVSPGCHPSQRHSAGPRDG